MASAQGQSKPYMNIVAEQSGRKPGRDCPACCSACRLPLSHCICSLRPLFRTQVGICLLYHPDEPARSSNTGHLVEECIDPCYSFVWSRTAMAPGLQDLLGSSEWDPQLVFPVEYAAPGQPVSNGRHVEDGRRPLLVIPDATWNQARKMLRQSPYLQQLPCLGLNPSGPSRYRLRRSRREDHLCTAEVAQQCLDLLGETQAAGGLGDYFDHYSDAWLAARNHQPRPSGA